MSQRGESPERHSSHRPSPDNPTSASSPALAKDLKDLVPAAALVSALTAPFQSAHQQYSSGRLDEESRRGRTSAGSGLGSSPFKSVRGMFGAEAREKWNTKNLGRRVAGDVASAATAGVCVAPVITAIDRAIIENASNRATLSSSIRTSLTTLLTSPATYLSSRPFLLIFSLYTATYLSANTLDTATSTIQSRPATSTTSGTSKFAATSATNLSLCLYKDSQFTKMFGAGGGGGGKVPGATYALFAVRDMLTIFASFNLPPMLADRIPMGEQMERHVSRISVAQFVAPAAVQVLSTPLHLLGLDLYNRTGKAGERVSVASRVGKVVKDWAPSCVFRICRIVPAFGVGGVVNRGMRERLLGRLE